MAEEGNHEDKRSFCVPPSLMMPTAIGKARGGRFPGITFSHFNSAGIRREFDEALKTPARSGAIFVLQEDFEIEAQHLIQLIFCTRLCTGFGIELNVAL